MEEDGKKAEKEEIEKEEKEEKEKFEKDEQDLKDMQKNKTEKAKNEDTEDPEKEKEKKKVDSKKENEKEEKDGGSEKKEKKKSESTSAPADAEDDDEKDMEQKLSTILSEHKTTEAESQVRKIFSKYASKSYAKFGKAGLKDAEDEYKEDETSEEYFANKFMNKAATREATLELIDTWDLALTAEQEDLFKEKHFEAAWAKFMTGGGLQFSDTKDFVNFMLEKHPKKKVSVDEE